MAAPVLCTAVLHCHPIPLGEDPEACCFFMASISLWCDKEYVQTLGLSYKQELTVCKLTRGGNSSRESDGQWYLQEYLGGSPLNDAFPSFRITWCASMRCILVMERR